MNAASGDRRQAALASLYRVRAAESEPDDSGIRQVWHQGSRGADLLSWVDANGRVNRQELTLLGDFFVWTSTEGLRTGQVREGDHARNAMKGSDLVSLDPALAPDRLLAAAQAMSRYAGEDRYIQHVSRVLALAASGLEHRDEVTVTQALGSVQVKAARPSPTPTQNRALALAGAGVVLALGLGALLLGR